MKDLIKYILVFILVVFSFFYTDKISKMIIYKSNLMKEILDNKDSFEVQSVDAIINDNNIVPGLNGKKVNELDSYYNMKSENVFNKDKLVYEDTYPTVSIFDNENKTITKGNSQKRSVSIMTNNKKIITYAQNNNIVINSYINNIIIDGKNYSISPSKVLKNDVNYTIDSGDIIYLNNNFLLNNFKTLIKKISLQDLKIISIDDLVSEKR